MSENPVFESKLTDGWRRFLAHVIENGFSVARRSPEDFIRHFPPAAIMQGLARRPQLRANILVIATGIRPRIAIKKTVESCIEDLEISLAEDEADAETVVTLFDPDDRVRYLDKKLLWKFITEGEFWESKKSDGDDYTIAEEHLGFILDRALKDGLITHQDVVEGVSVPTMAQLLPRDDLARIISGALLMGSGGNPFSEEALLDEVPVSILLQHIPLQTLWTQVVVPRIAEKYGFEEATTAEVSEPTTEREAVPEAPEIEVTTSEEPVTDKPNGATKIAAPVPPPPPVPKVEA
ncbi:MAG: hypothetical protein AAGF12_03275 [Myxococcota bacterium]